MNKVGGNKYEILSDISLKCLPGIENVIRVVWNEVFSMFISYGTHWQCSKRSYVPNDILLHPHCPCSGRARGFIRCMDFTV